MNQSCIVLETLPLRESDLLVTLLGKETGKISALARGARRSKRRFFSGIDIFDCGMFEITPAKGRERFYALDSIREKACWPGLRLNLESLTLASFCLETANRFSAPEDPECGKLFVPLFLSLKALDKAQGSAERCAVASYFSLHTLKLSGFDILEEPKRPNTELFRWLTEMDKAKAPIIPHNYSLARQGLLVMAGYSETVLGHPMKTAAQLSQIASLDLNPRPPKD